jgi:hypothetical protein
MAQHGDALFLRGVRRLLHPAGVAIIQTPIERYDYDHPFKTRPDWFDDVEHLFLYTDKAMRKLTATTRLEIVDLDDAPLALGQVCVLRRRGT